MKQISLLSSSFLSQWDTVTLKNLKAKFPDLKRKMNPTARNSSVDLECTRGADTDMLFVPELNKILMLDINTGSASTVYSILVIMSPVLRTRIVLN